MHALAEIGSPFSAALDDSASRGLCHRCSCEDSVKHPGSRKICFSEGPPLHFDNVKSIMTKHG